MVISRQKGKVIKSLASECVKGGKGSDAKLYGVGLGWGVVMSGPSLPYGANLTLFLSYMPVCAKSLQSCSTLLRPHGL